MNNLSRVNNQTTNVDLKQNRNTKKVNTNKKNPKKPNSHSWFYYLTYWAVIFFLLHIFHLIPFSPYFFYVCIVIFIALEIIYLAWYQIYYRITEPSNPNVIKTKESWSLFFAWLLLVLLLDIIPFFMLEPKFDLGSTLFTGIIVLVFLLLCKNTDVTFKSQYFSKGKRFSENAKKYTASQYLLLG